MKVFISYSSDDDVAVRSLADDLARARQQVWLDHELGGGDAWWPEILSQIRESAVFVFALSDSSLRSKPCRAELDYAEALGLPILPVQIGQVSTYRTHPIFARQLVDYRDRPGAVESRWSRRCMSADGTVPICPIRYPNPRRCPTSTCCGWVRRSRHRRAVPHDAGIDGPRAA